ncbi:MAG: hypothetical protein HY268_25135 [Deltaproteobacteria bacterium]|nr:hypothetical protein [Deltaproteobacteria bacterium]
MVFRDVADIDHEDLQQILETFSQYILPFAFNSEIKACLCDEVTSEGLSLWLRANALKLLSQQDFKEIVRIERTGEAFTGDALGAGLLA